MCNSLPAQSIIDALTSGTQNGTGTLMGSDAEFSMNWEWTLDKQFLKLTFENRRNSKSGEPIVFKANGYYKILSDSTIRGSWFDSRGISFPLKGSVSDTALTIIWGSAETEQGKTIYSVDSNGIKVEDYFLSENNYQQFGMAFYPR